MSESMRGMKRSHYCGHVTENELNQEVTVMGWVHKRRDLGQLIFIALRDRTGLLQVMASKDNDEVFKKAETVRGEYVLALTGIVRARAPENVNAQMETGKVEVEITQLRILAKSEVPPFSILDEGVANDMRLKYRYLDLRRPELQNNLFFRHRLLNATRQFLTSEGFCELETPLLTKSTPEGARDYLVPSRVHTGNFYALPQSPQIFKQLFMVSGFDKYFQIAKCFRDEDLRADRQPEFTQIDIEMSFVETDDVMALNERLVQFMFKELMDIDIPTPFKRMSYKEAMERYGSDKPDLRFGMELVDISKLVAGSSFNAFQNALDAGGSVRGLNAKGCAGLPRRQMDAYSDFVKTHGAKGLATIQLADGGVKSSLSKFLPEDILQKIAEAFNAGEGDLIFICADTNDIVLQALGALRLELAKKLELIKPDVYELLWVKEFPLLEWSEEDKRFYAMHHPFTSPMDEDLELLDKDPKAVRAKAYDLVLNGTELGGGSIRIYQQHVQERMFQVLGFSKEETYQRFGFMLDAFKYGAPPHGGIALGFDRLTMLLTGSESLRDIIAFPKVKDASCPMTKAPGPVDEAQLNELGLKLKG